MEGRTITRADLAESVYEEVGLSRNESAELVESVLDEVSEALIGGENVKISSFGSPVSVEKCLMPLLPPNPLNGELLPSSEASDFVGEGLPSGICGAGI